MSNYDLYEKVIEAFKSGDENLFNAAARNWSEQADDAPFEKAEDRDLFFKARRNYTLWKSGAINSRVSKIRMIDNVRQIAEKNLPNPYKKEVKKEKEPVRVLGVVPEEEKEEKHIFRRKKR